ncbi:DUF4870 domain-containing protein [Stieleria sp. JC731]|uniref:DUF4870 domain-containing protein n=1 Tax=Pirellulaceae TaxID=2691357 RepID=UPI001E4CDB23|nr:DUF4870 domain-containing protein [Stieleria sp. JC731]MCC9599478.1 DUF4870 domain-containing protein [Stieleria sp. JC731]
MTITDELDRLQQLRDQGSLTEAEFDEAKRKVLGGQTHNPYGSGSLHQGDGLVLGIDEKTFCTLMHLSQLLVLSMLGVVVPIGMWILGKEESDLVRRHGNRMMNWLISELIYGLVIGILCMFLVGFLLIPVIAVLGILFPIIAAIKCNNDTLWSYPLAIRFFDED